MVCDILAGERGSSCKNMNQISDVKVFYVRFVEPKALAKVDDEVNDSESIQLYLLSFLYFIFTPDDLQMLQGY